MGEERLTGLALRDILRDIEVDIIRSILFYLLPIIIKIIENDSKEKKIVLSVLITFP